MKIKKNSHKRRIKLNGKCDVEHFKENFQRESAVAKSTCKYTTNDTKGSRGIVS